MKYDVTFSCGHTGTVDLFGKSSERNKKIQYFEQFGVCKDCYNAQLREDAAKTPFTYHVSVLPAIDDNTGKIVLYGWFDGDAFPHKEAIKALGGYYWQACKASDNMLSMKRPPMCWGKVFLEDSLEAEVEKALGLGAQYAEPNMNISSYTGFAVAVELKKKWQLRQDQLNELKKPERPFILGDAKWNKKIYGKPGYLSIYLDNEKMDISDEDAEILREYVHQFEEYNEARRAILNS